MTSPTHDQGARADAAEADALAVDVSGLWVRFGSVEAVRGVSLQLAPGAATALLGRNGAGKSTTMRVLAGVVPPTSGRVLVAAGIPVREQAPAGPLSEQPAVRALLLAYAASLREPSDGASLTPEEAVDLITSCIGRAGPVSLRRVRHLVRTEQRAAGGNRPVDACLAELD